MLIQSIICSSGCLGDAKNILIDYLYDIIGYFYSDSINTIISKGLVHDTNSFIFSLCFSMRESLESQSVYSLLIIDAKPFHT